MKAGRSMILSAALAAGLAQSALAAPDHSATPGNVSTERRLVITESGIPAPYFRMHNPLSQNLATLLRGEEIYARRCSNCHGTITNPVGKLSGEITPSPTDLKALRQLSPKTLDGYMYWTITEGGVPFDTAMPSYKAILPRRDIWSVITFVRAVVGRGAATAPSGQSHH